MMGPVNKLRAVFWGVVLMTALSLPAWAATGTLLPQSVGYPRLVRLIYGPAASKGWIIGSTTGKLFVSKDDGKSFTFLADAPVRGGSRLRCCETIYELPQAIGTLPAGTLLYSATYSRGGEPPSARPGAQPEIPRDRGTPAIEVYQSTDQGLHWTYLATPVEGRGEKGTGGLWEPAFTVDHEGALVMFWSDETYSCCSQKLSKIRTSDGAKWKDAADVVASTNPADRPGMIVVSKLPTGLYFMTYEICGDPVTGLKCAVYYRMSRDGWNYGPPSNLGKKVENVEGQFFEHAPTNIWSPSPLSPEGVIVVVGQVLHNADGAVAQQNGRVLFMNTRLDGSNPWTTVKAPVEVPNSYDNPCPNYSSALLPTENGTALLEFASDYYELRKCGMYFATKSWTEMLSTNSHKKP